jgi:hypothetical protein
VAGCSHDSISTQKKEWLVKKKLAREKRGISKGRQLRSPRKWITGIVA